MSLLYAKYTSKSFIDNIKVFKSQQKLCENYAKKISRQKCIVSVGHFIKFLAEFVYLSGRMNILVSNYVLFDYFHNGLCYKSMLIIHYNA